jgi:hypothetical protein
MPPSVVLLALAVGAISAISAVQAAGTPRGFPAPSFHNYLADARFGKVPSSQAGVGVAATSGLGEAVAAIASEQEWHEYYRGPEYPPFIASKQICLAEQSQKNCRSTGCE